jgi:hypothetical protein
MDLRPELMPPILDHVLVARLARLAGRLDGAAPGQADDELAMFNKVAGTSLRLGEFKGISGAEEYDAWVRRVLYIQRLAPDPNLTRAEMIEIVRRISALAPDFDWYLELFLVNCKHPSMSDLLYWPNMVPEFPQDREPTAEEIADLALRGPA